MRVRISIGEAMTFEKFKSLHKGKIGISNVIKEDAELKKQYDREMLKFPEKKTVEKTVV